jgi:TldD protein
MKRWILALLAIAPASHAGPFEDVPTLRAMKDELARSVDKLELRGYGKPYYLSYQMWDLRRAYVTAQLGALVSTTAYPRRTLDIDLRIGDRMFDNANVAEPNRERSISLPIDDDYDAVRRDLWMATDRMYKTAVETFERKRAVAKAETKADADPGAFSQEPASHIIDNRTMPAIDRARLEALAKKLSGVFRTNHDIHTGTASFSVFEGKHYFVSSEGSASMQAGAALRLEVSCTAQADDGMPVRDAREWIVESLDQLPPEATLVAEVEKLSREVSALRTAPVVDDYAGPVLFTGVASGQVLRALIAESFAGTPAPRSGRPGGPAFGESELVGKVGERILPAGVSVIDDPTVTRVGKAVVVGGNHFDEEGMPTQKVSLVENGVFKRFLMSRIPRKGFEHTNGHAASGPFSSVRAHPANLILSSSAGVSDAEMRRRAIAAAAADNHGYVLVVERLDTGRHGGEDFFDPMSFMMGGGGDDGLPQPTVLRRVHRDGREELVRGARFGAVPLRSLKSVLAVGATPVVYSYLGSGMPSRFAMFTGGDGGYYVSIVAPALLFSDLDIKKPTGAHPSAPIAPRPN